jgi:mono/diheme cytochrome c family protein
MKSGPGIVLLLWVCAAGAAMAQSSPAEQRGRVFAHTNCSGCHSIDPVGPSPLSEAPPFRRLHENYPVESLEEALAEGIRTGHPGMPEFRLEPDQIGDLIAFLKSLED